MALRQSTRDYSGDQPRMCAASKRPPPQLPGRNKKTPAKKSTSLTAPSIEVAGSNDEPAVTNGTNGNEGNISFLGQQGKVGGDNKYNDINDADIGKSDGEVGDDNDGDGVIDGNEVNQGGDNEVSDHYDGNGGNNQVGDDTNGNGVIDHNEVNDGDNDGAPSNESDSENVSSASSGNEGFIVAANNKRAWMSAHQCICAEEAPVLCKGNSTEMCLRTVHQECLLFWERTQPASTVRGATPKGTDCLVYPMHHPQYEVKRWKAFQREKYHPPPPENEKSYLLTVRLTASIAVKAMTAASL